VRRHLADMAMFDPRAHPLHAALGFVLVPPDERGCRKTCGIGVKRTQILGMGCSTLTLDLWQGSLTCRRNGRFLVATHTMIRVWTLGALHALLDRPVAHG
jgi:hypothetical protein